MALAVGKGRPVAQRRSWSMRLRSRTVGVNLLRLFVIITFLAAWQLASNVGLINTFFTSNPSKIWDQLWELVKSGDAFRHTRVTVQEALLGLVIGSAAGVLTGFLLSRWRTLEEIFEPFITVANSVPRLALTPLFIVWFGVGLVSKIMLVITLVYFVLLVNTLAAVKSVDPDLVIVARLMGASKRRVVRSVVLPSAVPWIFAGLRLGLAYAFAGAVVGEMIAAQSGLGYLVSYSAGTLNITGVMVAVVIVMFVAYTADLLLSKVERRLLQWRPAGITRDV